MRLPPSAPATRSRTALAALLLLASAPGSAQVIRSYEALDRAAGDGAYATLAFGFDGSMGNTDKAEFDLSSALGLRGERHWVRIYPSYLIRRRGSETTEREGAVHLRHSYAFSATMSSYAFVQLQSDRSLDLERRALLGGGIRRRLVALEGGGVDLGLGVMREEERITGGGRDQAVRGANLFSVSGRAGVVALTVTGFYQQVLDDWRDYRLALSGSAAVPLGAGWAMDVSFRWRMDTRPPKEVERNDAGLSVGLQFTVN